MDQAYYSPTDDPSRFTATTATTGPWQPGVQHGGPPAALLARAIESVSTGWPAAVVRLSVDLLGPVPVGDVQVQAQLDRPGRNVARITATLRAADRVAVAATAWAVRRTEAAPADGGAAAAPGPDELPPHRPDGPGTAAGDWGGYVASLDARFVEGGWDEPGPAVVWLRPRLPLVAGESTSGLAGVMLVADCGNGVSGALDLERWLFVNPELTVHLARAPRPGWLCLAARTHLAEGGSGLAASRILDGDGLVAHGAQSLLVAPRPVP